ncbi:unnamed protein product, partial [Linum tenue]
MCQAMIDRWSRRTQVGKFNLFTIPLVLDFYIFVNEIVSVPNCGIVISFY